MGCWGITAFESNTGLDAVGMIRKNLPEDGRLKLENLIETLHQISWNTPPDESDGRFHTSPMALAEIVVKFIDRDIESLDYDGKFSAVISFSASKKSIQWLRDYISNTLRYAKENAEFQAEYGEKWGAGLRKRK